MWTSARYTASRSASVYVGAGVMTRRISSSSSTATSCPRERSSAAARAMVDLPLPGRPVVQIAQLIGVVSTRKTSARARSASLRDFEITGRDFEITGTRSAGGSGRPRWGTDAAPGSAK
jgi:hypothetical protein